MHRKANYEETGPYVAVKFQGLQFRSSVLFCYLPFILVAVRKRITLLVSRSRR